MPTGLIKSYNTSKGYGFVDHDGKDVFIMAKELNGRIVKTGDKVTFTVTKTDKGTQATKVKITECPEGEKYKGEIKTYAHKGAYGFITCAAFEGQDIFFFKDEVSEAARECIKPGSWCIFKLKETEKGPQATDVFMIGAAGNAVKNHMQNGGGKGWGKGYDNGLGGLGEALQLAQVVQLVQGLGQGGGYGGYGGGGYGGGYGGPYGKGKGKGWY